MNIDQLLSELPPFTNKEKVLINDQNVNDIINAIVKAQKKYQKDYYNIYPYFVGSDEIETARNVWNFLKKNSDYVIELDTQQTIKSPAAIISTRKSSLGGNDCKNLALFSAGIMSAYRDNELKNFELFFRFAAYDYFDKIPQHVFVVMKIGKKEIWIDPVLDRFDEHRQPTYYIDKKINPMALVALSGVYNSNSTQQPVYTDFGNVTGTISEFNNQSNMSTMSGGQFGFGENKLRDQMIAFIEKYPLAFMYLYLPVGHEGDQGWGTEYGWNSYEIPGIPDIVKQKRNKAFWTMWNWGEPTGLKAETDITKLIRDNITKKLGMSPEQYWSKKLGLNIADKAVFSGVEFTDAADVVVPGSGKVLKFVGPVIDMLVPDLTWTHQPDTFQPVAEDWQYSIYATKFPINTNTPNGGNLTDNGPITTLTTPGTKSAGMNIFVTLAIAGAAIFALTKIKK
jgi:hypothetical protein